MVGDLSQRLVAATYSVKEEQAKAFLGTQMFPVSAFDITAVVDLLPSCGVFVKRLLALRQHQHLLLAAQNAHQQSRPGRT